MLRNRKLFITAGAVMAIAAGASGTAIAVAPGGSCRCARSGSEHGRCSRACASASPTAPRSAVAGSWSTHTAHWLSMPIRCACARHSAISWTTRCAMAAETSCSAPGAGATPSRSMWATRASRATSASVHSSAFARGDEARGRGGAGLGLAIVRAIAEAHGGTAAIVPGAQTVVRVRLPDVAPGRPGGTGWARPLVESLEPSQRGLI